MEPSTLTEIEQLASLNYTPEEVSVIIGIDKTTIETAIQDPSSEIYRSYWKGFYTTDIKLRQSIIKLAVSGSSPAQNLALKMQENQIMKLKSL
jgi:hypothetical protein